MYLCALACVLAAVVSSHSDSDEHDHGGLDVSVAATFTGLNGDNPTSTFSVEYIPDKDLYYFVDWGADENLTPGGSQTFFSLNGDFASNPDNADLKADVMDGATLFTGVGMVYNDGKLYGVSLFGGVLNEYDIDTKQQTKSMFVGPIASGLCNDPDNPEMLYATTFMFDGVDGSKSTVQEIDTSTANWTQTYLYHQDTDEAPQAIADLGRPMLPNSCWVTGGKLYIVELAMPSTFVTYDIEKETWSAVAAPFMMGEGLAGIGDYLFATGFADDGIWSWKIDSDEEWHHWPLGLSNDVGGNSELDVGPGNVLVLPNLFKQFGQITFIKVDIESDSEDAAQQMGVFVTGLLSLMLFVSAY